MKRAATHLFKRQRKNSAFFEIFELFYLRPPGSGGGPRAGQRSKNPTQGATRMCESRGSSGLELTDALCKYGVACR